MSIQGGKFSSAGHKLFEHKLLKSTILGKYSHPEALKSALAANLVLDDWDYPSAGIGASTCAIRLNYAVKLLENLPNYSCSRAD
jgi:hypothetical protein